MSLPEPVNPQIVSDADIYGAVYAYIAKFALPPIPVSNIFRGWQNATFLPSGSNEYAVMSIISHMRRGTTIESFDAARVPAGHDGTLTGTEMIFVRIQIDICSDDDNAARRRAQMLEMVARSSVGVQFFNDRGMSCNYATDPRDLSFVNGAKAQVKRWMIELELSFNMAFSVEIPWFDAVNVEIENVDVHHKPDR